MSDVRNGSGTDTLSLQNRIAELEQEVAAKQKLVATVSHELRTPMGAIISMAELLSGQTTEDSRKKYADTLKLSANSLLSIVNQLLDDSKSEATKNTSKQEVFSLHALINTTISALEARLSDRPIKTTLNCSDTLPDTVAGDAGKLNQVLNNLIDNAVKFTQVGEIALSVRSIETEMHTHLIEFSLQDTGLGIEPEARKKIFSPYTQADSSISSEYGGTGLGLSICRELVEELGGNINCDSNPGLGSVFTFTVEFKPVCEVSQNHREVSQTPNTNALPHILVVDDNKINQMLITTYLEQGELSFHVVSSGREALEEIEKQHFDLVLMDVQMPEMDGVEATRHIRALAQPSADIPIVALTANAMEGDREKYISSGMNDYLAKPVTAESLYEMIWKYTSTPERESVMISG